MPQRILKPQTTLISGDIIFHNSYRMCPSGAIYPIIGVNLHYLGLNWEVLMGSIRDIVGLLEKILFFEFVLPFCRFF